MSVWRDPYLKQIRIPPELKTTQFRLGSARFSLLPKQYEFLQAHEEFLSYISGVGAGKTKIGSIKSAYISVDTPGNRIVVGRLNHPDLLETSQRDLLEFLSEAQLLKKAPSSDKRTALVHCIDLKTNLNLGYDSEISFQHLDDPEHLRGRHLGGFWIDEGSEVHPNAWHNLVSRLRLPAAKGIYQAFVTGNPRGHNWIYDLFFNSERLLKITCGGSPGQHAPTCPDRDDKACNKRMRMKRRGIHSTSYENYYLPPETIENMLANYNEERIAREIEGSFEVFEGQAFREFRHDTHVITPPENWINGRPPKEWPRIMACDVGGSSPWAFIWAAIDPFDNVIAYDEVYMTTTNVEALVELAYPKMFDEENKPYTFRAKVIDYENKVAAEDLRRRGIHFTNAQKHGKAGSIARFSSYLHPNAKHHFPNYHPRAGQSGSPRWFFTTNCPNNIREIPQQRWKEDVTNQRLKDELDRTIANHATDCDLYISRELPEPATLKPAPGFEAKNISLMSRMYYADLKKQEEKKAQAKQEYRIKPFNIGLYD